MRSEVQIFPDPPFSASRPILAACIAGYAAPRRSNDLQKMVTPLSRSERILTQDFFCVARRRLSEGGSVQTAHDRLSEDCNAGTGKKDKSWGHSSAGRAPALHAGGRRFDPAWLHQFTSDAVLTSKRTQDFGTSIGLFFCSLTIWKFLTS